MFGREPVMITEAIKAVLLCALAFGLPLTEGQLVSVMVAVGAVLAVLARGQVTPVGR